MIQTLKRFKFINIRSKFSHINHNNRWLDYFVRLSLAVSLKMKMKWQMIQCIAIVNLIEMRLMKAIERNIEFTLLVREQHICPILNY
jgi:hypothetical protein